MEEEQKIYNEQGVEAYVKYQLDHENEPFLPGAAFPFVKVSVRPPTPNLHRGPDPNALGRGESCGVLRGEGMGNEQRGRRDVATEQTEVKQTSWQVMCFFQD